MVIVIRKRHIIFSVFCCSLLLIISFMFSFFPPDMISTSSGANSNWGLSFPDKGKPPVGNATSDFLKQYDSYYLGNTSEKCIYITFDAGYENGYTPNILDALKKHDVKATFFVVGNYIKTAPDLVKRMVSEGHIVGNHTYTHPDMSKISDMESFKKEITLLEDMYKETTGEKELSKFYRPPQGKYSENNLKLAKELGYKTIFWSLAYVDWLTDKQPTKEHAFEKLSRIHNGAIVLLHSTSKTNSEILDELLTKWKNEGYTFGTLSDLC